MQTFLPYPSFYDSARVLDNRRLGKQRVEAYQILRTLCGQSQGWRHHPAVRMWRGHECVLMSYAMIIASEWIDRGYDDTVFDKLVAMHEKYCCRITNIPPWLGNEAFHASHRSNLLRKDPVWYGQFGWVEPPTLPYIWPTGANLNPPLPMATMRQKGDVSRKDNGF